LELSNGTMHSLPGTRHAEPNAVITADRSVLEGLIATGEEFADLVEAAAITVEGDDERVRALFGNLHDFPLFWNVIEP
tara:strand:+ start:288 stop:521 length:234 start_codon:yes stop_codon:yes gene_type:complete